MLMPVSPFRSEVAALTEQLRRADEANAVVAGEVEELAKELALRGELHGPARGTVRVVVWCVAALATLSVGWLLGYAFVHYPRAAVINIQASPEVRRANQARADGARCEVALKRAKDRIAACAAHAPPWGREVAPAPLPR